jgi:hypothetical protein
MKMRSALGVNVLRAHAKRIGRGAAVCWLGMDMRPCFRRESTTNLQLLCHHEAAVATEGSAFLSTTHRLVLLSEDAPKGRASESNGSAVSSVILSARTDIQTASSAVGRSRSRRACPELAEGTCCCCFHPPSTSHQPLATGHQQLLVITRSPVGDRGICFSIH